MTGKHTTAVPRQAEADKHRSIKGFTEENTEMAYVFSMQFSTFSYSQCLD